MPSSETRAKGTEVYPGVTSRVQVNSIPDGIFIYYTEHLVHDLPLLQHLLRLVTT